MKIVLPKSYESLTIPWTTIYIMESEHATIDIDIHQGLDFSDEEHRRLYDKLTRELYEHDLFADIYPNENYTTKDDS